MGATQHLESFLECGGFRGGARVRVHLGPEAPVLPAGEGSVCLEPRGQWLRPAAHLCFLREKRAPASASWALGVRAGTPPPWASPAPASPLGSLPQMLSSCRT